MPPAIAPIGTPSELGGAGILARAEAVDTEDHFHVLGVADNASIEAVRAAYLRLAKSWHPDRIPPELTGLRNEVAKVFSSMTRAQQTLCNADTRRAYLAAHNEKREARPRADVLKSVQLAVGKRDAATVVALCQELIDADGGDAEALAVQAWAQASFGEASDDDLRATLSKMDKAVNTDRTADAAVYHRGLVHKRLNNVPAAFRDFARALQLNPKHLDAEREVRIFAMRARKGSGEHKLALNFIDKMGKK